jgi:uncharacterized protein YutE (UPF0331/DUF86 family)
MVGFRNISVHDYGVIKNEVVVAIVDKHLVDFEKIYQAIYGRVTQIWRD